MTDKQREVIGDRRAIQVNLTDDGQQIHEIGVKAGIEMDTGSKAVYVYYVDEDGNVTYIESKYDTSTGMVYFDVEHFSTFMLSESEYVAPSSDDTMLYVGIAVAAIAILAFAAIAVITRIRHRSSK